MLGVRGLRGSACYPSLALTELRELWSVSQKNLRKAAQVFTEVARAELEGCEVQEDPAFIADVRGPGAGSSSVTTNTSGVINATSRFNINAHSHLRCLDLATSLICIAPWSIPRYVILVSRYSPWIQYSWL